MLKFEVGISTRDRWHNLERTIVAATRFLPRDVIIRIAVDGGSAPLEIKQSLSRYNIDWREDTCRKGYIARRNELINACQAPYYLSLDDDSYPAEFGLENALALLETSRDIGVLGFPIKRPDGSWQVASSSKTPYQTRSYVGCAHLLRVEPFVRYGGYDITLIHQGEESQWGAQLWKNGLKCMHFPGVTFIHEATVVARSNERIRFHAARNKILWTVDFTPSHPQMIWRIFRVFCDQTLWALRERSIARVRGLLAGLSHGFISGRPKHALTSKQFNFLIKLPYY